MKSYTTQTREALNRGDVMREKNCCRRTEILAFTRCSGSMTLMGGGGLRLAVRTEQAGTARRMMRLFHAVYQISPDMRIVEAKRLGGRTSYEMRVEDNIARLVLEESGAFSEGRVIPRSCVLKKCCREAFLRATFLGCGSLSNPEDGFRMEFALSDEEQANTLAGFLKAFYAIKSGVTQRKEQWIVYLRETDSILSVLSAIGAGGAILEIENARIRREARNNANRAANCDTANITKMVTAAGRQLEAIEKIGKTIGLSGLPDVLREIAVLRMENPEASLEELGNMLEPPMGKSGVYHRLKRLELLADTLEERRGGHERNLNSGTGQNAPADGIESGSGGMPL